MTRNSFDKGLNKDVDKLFIADNQYRDARNVNNSEDGKFFALTNIGGTELLQSIGLGDYPDAVVYQSRYKIGDEENVKCLTIFTVSGSFSVWCYRIDTADLFLLYTEPSVAGQEVDAVLFADNSLDFIYFTDNRNELRRLRCEVPLPYSPNFNTREGLSLQRRLAGTTDVTVVQGSGASLLAGKYQAAFRLWNNVSNTYSKWGTLSNMAHIFSKPGFSEITTFATGGLGQIVSDMWPVFTVTPDTEQQSQYTHVQLAVVEFVDAESPLTAQILDAKPIGASVAFTYKANQRTSSIPIDELVIDDAAIETAKTLLAKDNYLMAGNITYRDRVIDTATSVTGSLIYQTSTPDLYSDPSSLLKLGYWRDEVYRFGIVYFDEFGNYSPVKALDMSAVSGNTSTSTDYRFPSRKNPNSGSLFISGNNNSGLRNIGLSLSVSNHPTWAKGFVIVRAKRIKRIQFQTPFIPCANILGAKANGTYPSQALERGATAGSTVGVNYSDAQPMNPLGTYVPKNFFTGFLRNTKINTNEASTFEGNVVWQSDAFEGSASASSVVYIGLNPNAYIDGSYQYNSGDKFELVDVANLYSLINADKSEGSYTTGDNVKTKVHGTFFALRNGDYYYYNGVGSSRANPTAAMDGPISGFGTTEALGEGISINGLPFGRFENLETSGINWYQKPNNQKLAVFSLKNSRTDITYTGTPGANGSLSSTFGSQPTFRNLFANEKTGYVDGFTLVNTVEIVNITRGVGDDRYGDPTSNHDFISTGTSHVFSEAELATIASGGATPITKEVWGGDCFVSIHSIKISDSLYGVQDPADSESTLITKWERTFRNNKSFPHRLPVGYAAASQVISVAIESDVNGGILDTQSYPATIRESHKIPYASASSQFRVPFSYNYNANYSRSNDRKVFFTIPDSVIPKNKFKSRIAYTDPKIYQTDTEGFDRWRALNIYDLDESFGGITKLVLSGDDVHVVQDRAISYIPVGSNIIETSDLSTLQVRSAEVIGTPKFVSTIYGSTKLRTVVPFGNGFFFADDNNGVIGRVAGKLDILSDQGIASEIKNLDVRIAIYDNNRQQALFAGQDFCYIFDQRFNAWVANYEFDSDHQLKGGIFFDNKFFWLGQTDGLSVYEAYADATTQLFGKQVTPSVTFVVNDKSEISKVFDNYIINSTDRLATVDSVVYREDALGNQEANNLNIDQNPREGNYRVKILRDNVGARLRGLYMESVIKWKTSESKRVTLNSVVTKYRESHRIL